MDANTFALISYHNSVAVDFAKWQCVAETADRLHAEGNPIHVAMVGKYTDLSDSYLSVIRSLQHASYFVKRQMKIDWIEATDLEDKNGGT
jgi:CTP synthase